jgi:hypothetical protein
MMENEWRAEACPNYGYAYCACDIYMVECPGSWDCVDIENIAVETLDYYNTNGDDVINPYDDIDPEHYEVL